MLGWGLVAAISIAGLVWAGVDRDLLLRVRWLFTGGAVLLHFAFVRVLGPAHRAFEARYGSDAHAPSLGWGILSAIVGTLAEGFVRWAVFLPALHTLGALLAVRAPA